MKKLSNSLSAVVFKCTSALATIVFIATVCIFCSCSKTASYYEESNTKLSEKLKLYENYYEAAENFTKMVEKAEWVYNGHEWGDTYWCSEEGQDLIEAKADIDAMLNKEPLDSTCVYVPSYNDLLKERNMLWNLLQITAAQDTTKWEKVVKKTPEYKDYDEFLEGDWEDMEYWKFKPIDLDYKELSEE